MWTECGVGYGPVAGTCEHGHEISGSISGVEFPGQRRITFQDCVHRKEYSSVYFAYAFCERKVQAASDESLYRFPSRHHGSTVLPGRISICHTAIFVIVGGMTGRLSTKNRQWRGVYNSSRERRFAKSPSNEKTSNAGMANVTSGSFVPNHCLRVQALQHGDAAARNRSLSLDRGTVSAMKTHFVLWSELTRDDIIKCHNIHGWFLNTSPDFRASNVQRRSSMNAWRGRQWADSFLTNVHKHQTATCSSYGTSCFFVWNAFLSRTGYTRGYNAKAPMFVSYTRSCVEHDVNCVTADSRPKLSYFSHKEAN